ncbi:hypothetical protein [Rhizobium sp. P44RR-XXIV]|uniref:hypothetical protein n=1 Tax=Rhizobium sp. P44RR-XXIV TaxID=1921145 RepID=UPI0009CD06E1|nr:hypothetical protein [Rhizobium sp. P44RR-XXIV]TIX90336.1 hypothetical protein BSK43_013665 [Rhizobium sp. P44RR-XXIV]
MQTWLTYENVSLNPHVSRVGIFWDVSGMLPGTMPVLWAAIERCRYGWHHPLHVSWEPAFLIRDSYGNECPLQPGRDNGDTGTRIEGPHGYGLKSGLLLSQSTPRPDLSLCICRDNRPIAELPLDRVGAWAVFMPDRLKFQIDCRAALRGRITDAYGTPFALSGLQALTVQLRGGAPGPRATPLTFVSYRAEPA